MVDLAGPLLFAGRHVEGHQAMPPIQANAAYARKCAALLMPLRRHGPTGIRFCAMDCSAEALRQTERSLGCLVPDLPRGQVRAG